MHFNFFDFLFGGDDNAAASTADVPTTFVNPATGLPMMDSGMGGVDVGGSPFGMDIHSDMNDDFMDSIGTNPWD